MKQLLALTCLLALSTTSFGQEKKFKELQADNEWSDGSIMLNDGTELKGLVRFDDRNGILGYQNGNDSRSLTPRNVMGFEFTDPVTKKQRLYYALEFEDPQNNARRPMFFEVLKDFKSFAVVARIDPPEFKERKSGGGGFAAGGIGAVGPTVTTMVIRQTETIYFLNQEGALEPYSRVIHKVVDSDLLYDRDKLKKKTLDKGVLQKYFTPEENAAMEKFADQNDLDFRLKDDFVKVLDFCVSLREKK